MLRSDTGGRGHVRKGASPGRRQSHGWEEASALVRKKVSVDGIRHDEVDGAKVIRKRILAFRLDGGTVRWPV